MSFLHNPAEAKARKLKKDIANKVASRKFDAYCATAGINAMEAQILAPENVKRGKALRNIEQRHRQKEAFHSKKEKLARKFQSGSA